MGSHQSLKSRHVKRASTPGLEDQSDSEDDLDSTDGGSASHSRLDVVEHHVAERGQQQRQEGKKDSHKLSKVSQIKSDGLKCNDSSDVSDSDNDDCEIPILSTLRSSKTIQKHVNRAVADLEKSQARGKDHVVKSKRGGGAVDVVVANKVNWPHEYILGSVSKQKVTFDQLNLTQFVNGFLKGFWMRKMQVSGKNAILPM